MIYVLLAHKDVLDCRDYRVEAEGLAIVEVHSYQASRPAVDAPLSSCGDLMHICTAC